jgi:hypothetical protein
MKVLKKLTEKLESFQEEYCPNSSIDDYECGANNALEHAIKITTETLQNISCENCRNKGKCAICDNFNIQFCSDWEESVGSFSFINCGKKE